MAYASTNFSGFLNEVSASEELVAEAAGQSEAAQEGGILPLRVLPSAPAAPSAGGPVYTGARAAMPMTSTMNTESMGQYLSDPSAPRGFAELVASAGGDADTEVSLFLDIPEETFRELLDVLTVDEEMVTAIQRSTVVRYLRRLYETRGFEPPSLGGTKRPAPQQQQPLPQHQPPAPPEIFKHSACPASSQQPPDQEIATELVNLNQVVDQSLRAQVRLLTYAELAHYRGVYERATGAPPSEEQLPTADQLAGLRAVLKSGRVPFVDFGVWSHLGPRLSKFRRTEASVFVGGELVTKSLDGPATFAGWEESWGIFAVAMISLGQATPGSMQAYLNGVKTMLRLFPTKWGSISAADLVMRSERWGRMRELFERSPPANFSAAMPWDSIISGSAFGNDSAHGNWWHMNFVLPATLSVPTPATEGMSKASGGGGGDKPRAAPRQPPKSKEVCTNFNFGVGSCAGTGPCAFGRKHVCSVCGKPHRAMDFHDKARAEKSKGKGKGKGKKGGKGQERSSEA